VPLPLIRKIVTIATVVLLVFFLCATIFVGFYNLHEFRPYAGKIEAIYQAMDREDRQPPANVQSFIWTVEGNIVDGFAARNLLYELRRPMRMSAWHYHSAMWALMLRLHFDRTKRLSFYCHYLPHENGVGFASAAEVYFGKKPEELTEDQLATLVAIGRLPSANSATRHPESLARSQARLLEAARTQ
jgi:Transglycosylase